ncbi:alpha-amylase [Nodosilinea sp. LEGE 07298]|uniref:plasmid mobilization protein n=2 Tax=Nodosilinea TaxID=1120752 RepID=UPI0018800375|nr:alpha-amylase [Nodosilinea sp. LEGE 07298]MBE9108392.1 alpha-amylase [Nodosilinea sp. LEGE 07298]
MPKTTKRTETIEVQCTPEQKAQIRQYAVGAGTSMSTYLLDCGLKRRRQVEGPLINLSLFQQLAELTEALKSKGQGHQLEDVLELIWEVRREIALRRLGDAIEKVLPKS